MADDILVHSMSVLEELVSGMNSDRFAILYRIDDAARSVGEAWSGSWLGYHSTVYYADFVKPPAGARFSSEWGLMNDWGEDTVGDWREYSTDDIRSQIESLAGSLDVTALEKEASTAAISVEDEKAVILSRLKRLQPLGEDAQIDRVVEDISKLECSHSIDFLEHWKPSGQIISRDSAAVTGGLKAPVHLKILAQVYSIRVPYHVADSLLKLVGRALRLIDASSPQRVQENQPVGTKVFIGHGGSLQWLLLKDFLNDTLGLEWEEFNRIPSAGCSTVERLDQMMHEARFAFLVLTGEDEVADGEIRPRLNVVHEAGLFQGRLGFRRAIILLEEGCSEFSNIIGLTQIRFPKGNIAASFEEVRKVLTREGINTS